MEDARKLYEHPRLILCEGPEDVGFFHRLIRDRHLPNCHISHTGVGRYDAGGNTKFCQKLRSLRLNRSFSHTVERILVVTDSDEDAVASFEAVRDQIESAGYAAPVTPGVTVSGSPAMCLITLPLYSVGNLECILAAAARIPDAARTAFVDHFVDQVALAPEWTDAKKGKLWLRAMVAASWPRDPGINLSPLFRDDVATRIIPTEVQEFNALSSLLAAF